MWSGGTTILSPFSTDWSGTGQNPLGVGVLGLVSGMYSKVDLVVETQDETTPGGAWSRWGFNFGSTRLAHRDCIWHHVEGHAQL